LQILEHATTYHEQTVERWLPPDLRDRLRPPAKGRGTFS